MISILTLLLLSVSYINGDNFVTEWSALFTAVTKASGPFVSPPMVARALAIYSTCMYDTWTVYDSKALPTYSNGISKRRGSARDIQEAVSYAAYMALHEFFESRPDQLSAIQSAFEDMGYSHNTAMGTPSMSSAAGIGVAACKEVLNRRRHDGANSEGDMYNTAAAKIYSDYTNTYSFNAPQVSTTRTNCSALRSINTWQPLKIPNRDGTTTVQGFASPQMFMVPMYGSDHQFKFYMKYRGPAANGTNTNDRFFEEATEVLTYSSEMDDMKKAIAEFWADGPLSTYPPGHWFELAKESAINEDLSVAETIKLQYLQANAVMDAGIASWTLKKLWASSRPITQIQCLYQGKRVKAWAGPYMGVQEIDGGDWQPYQNKYFVTPAFPGYVSGHSSFSAASAAVFQLYFGDDKYRANSFNLKAGMSLFEPKITEGMDGYIRGVTDVPNNGPESVGYSPAEDITLSWKTWTEAANQAGMSRLYGGIHVMSDNVDGLDIGYRLGRKVYSRAMKLFSGDAKGQKAGI